MLTKDKENIDINKIDRVIVYNVDFESGTKSGMEELSGKIQYTIDIPNEYSKTISYKNDKVLWKGDKFGIMKYDNRKLKIRISSYGSFFSIKGVDGYYSYVLKDR